jgi:hypothetical protein
MIFGLFNETRKTIATIHPNAARMARKPPRTALV